MEVCDSSANGRNDIGVKKRDKPHLGRGKLLSITAESLTRLVLFTYLPFLTEKDSSIIPHIQKDNANAVIHFQNVNANVTSRIHLPGPASLGRVICSSNCQTRNG